MKVKEFMEELDNSVLIRLDRKEIWIIKDGKLVVTDNPQQILTAYDMFKELENNEFKE